jgi:hypothetical protein
LTKSIVFDNIILYFRQFSALLVQLVERRFPKPDVEGSSPSGRGFAFNIKYCSGEVAEWLKASDC